MGGAKALQLRGGAGKRRPYASMVGAAGERWEGEVARVAANGWDADLSDV